MQNQGFRNLSLETVEEFLDYVLAATCVAAVVLGAALLGRGASLPQLLFFDIGAIPWGKIWEVVEGLGLTAGVTRGAIWLWRKLGGDKYAVAIWGFLDKAAPHGLPKHAIEDRVRDVVKEKREDKFRKKFDKAWMKLRKAGDIKSVQDQESDTVYKLKIDE